MSPLEEGTENARGRVADLLRKYPRVRDLADLPDEVRSAFKNYTDSNAELKAQLQESQNLANPQPGTIGPQ